MHKILPRFIKNLIPISGNRNTFGENTFCVPFNNLSFKEKIQVAVDLVRQSMLYCDIPNPETENSTMVGDSYTACCVLKTYLIRNNLGRNHIVCYVEGRKYEISSIPHIHFILLVSDDYGNWYQLDPSPMVGYKCGKVELYKDTWYKTYIPIVGKKAKFLKEIRTNIYYAKETSKPDLARNVYNSICDKGLFLGYYEVLCSIDETLVSKIDIDRINRENKPVLEKEIENLTIRLEDLQKDNDSLKEQLELIQMVHRLKIDLGYERETEVFINGECVKVSNLTPRYFYLSKLNTVIIKPSSYYISMEKQFTEIMQGENDILSCYLTNMGDASKYGVSVMNFFHPDGYKYSDEMNGPCYLFVVNEPADVLLRRKKHIRKKYAYIYDNKTVKWFNGKEILWTSLGMNMVHSSDNSCEACCNFQSSFAESQLMTRFMYPNPNFIF